MAKPNQPHPGSAVETIDTAQQIADLAEAKPFSHRELFAGVFQKLAPPGSALTVHIKKLHHSGSPSRKEGNGNRDT